MSVGLPAVFLTCPLKHRPLPQANPGQWSC